MLTVRVVILCVGPFIAIIALYDWTILFSWWQGLSIRQSSLTNSSRPSSMVQDENYPNAIAAPLKGVDISLDSAQTLAGTLDQIATEGGVKLLNFAYIKLDEKRLLGQGSFSRVYSGTYRNRVCAVKMIYTLDLTVETISRIAAEAELLSSVKHPNIVNIFGVSVLPPSVCILLELCKYGSLADVLRGRLSSVVEENSNSVAGGRLHLSVADHMFLALGCARGVAALHKHEGVCHRDIKSFNFLVDNQLNAKVADLELGVSKTAVNNFYRKRNNLNDEGNGWFRCCLATSSTTLTGGHSSPLGSVLPAIRDSVQGLLSVLEPIEYAEDILANWAAPEFIQSGVYTQSSDIYSLGIVFWEIVSKEVPFDDATAFQRKLRKQVLAARVLLWIYYIASFWCIFVDCYREAPANAKILLERIFCVDKIYVAWGPQSSPQGLSCRRCY